jgi:hypothetical protein
LRTQSLSLKKGWNSVFLNVFPENPDPVEVFKGTPVSIAAAYFRSESSTRFISDPTTSDLKKEGWSIWYAPNRPDAALADLGAIFGNRAYLLYAESDFTWSVEGVVHFGQIRWKPDSFNLVGFPVNTQSPPTFDKFFSGSKAHAQMRIYGLVDEKWKRLTNPSSEVIKSGAAYWVYSEGASDHQGPIEVRIPKGEAIIVGTQVPSATVMLTNTSADPVDISVERNGTGSDHLPLGLDLKGFDQTTKRMTSVAVEFPATLNFKTLEPGEKAAFVFESRVEQMQSNFQATLLKISTQSGIEHWVPVIGTRPDMTSGE